MKKMPLLENSGIPGWHNPKEENGFETQSKKTPVVRRPLSLEATGHVDSRNHLGCLPEVQSP